MVLFTNSLLYDILGIIVTFAAGFILYAKWKLTYWSKKGVYTKETIVPIGNAKKVFLKQQIFGELWKDVYDSIKAKGLKYGGGYFFVKPFFVPVDLEIIKHIMQNDFQYFVSHGTYINESGDPLSAHLFSLSGDKWRNLRVKLTPTFTSGKMKMMFNRLVECSMDLKSMIQDCSNAGEPLDIKEMLQRFTIDIIVSCAFGLDSNTMKNPDSEFSRKGRQIFLPDRFNTLKILSQFALPHNLLRWINMKVINPEVSEFFMKVIRKNVDYREKNNIFRKDFMHLLLQLKNRGQVFDDEKLVSDDGLMREPGLSINELAAQAFVFFVAGFETSSTTMTFALFELATHPDIQDKLRKEITSVLKKHDGKMTYEALKDMHYMDQVLQETLRKYPAAPVIPRVCTKEYRVPGTNLVIEKGTMVSISNLGIHHDPELYPDPEKFDPDRFSEENKHSRHQFAWIPFGEGPRMCIGLRFGLMQAKVGLTTILENYDISLSSKTKLPLKFDQKGFILNVEGGVWINATKREL